MKQELFLTCCFPWLSCSRTSGSLSPKSGARETRTFRSTWANIMCTGIRPCDCFCSDRLSDILRPSRWNGLFGSSGQPPYGRQGGLLPSRYYRACLGLITIIKGDLVFRTSDCKELCIVMCQTVGDSTGKPNFHTTFEPAYSIEEYETYSTSNTESHPKKKRTLHFPRPVQFRPRKAHHTTRVVFASPRSLTTYSASHIKKPLHRFKRRCSLCTVSGHNS
jgi:hypothetical protein